jgi:hypothetical protein
MDTHKSAYQNERRERLKWLFDYLLNASGIDKNSILRVLMNRYGLTKRTAEDYLFTLIDGIDLKFDDKNILQVKSELIKKEVE